MTPYGRQFFSGNLPFTSLIQLCYILAVKKTVQSNSDIISKFKTISRASSIIVILIGVIALIGWMFDITALKSVVSGLPNMMPNTAIAFILSGVSLLLLQEPAMSLRGEDEAISEQNKKKLIAQICAIIALIIGILTLSEYIFRINLGIDQLVIKDTMTAEKPYPGRMAPHTALNFIFVGISLLLIDSKFRKFCPSQLFSMLVFVISILSLMGQSYGIKSLYSISRFTGMALPTSIGFLIISSGILFSRPEYGIMAVVSSNSIGGFIARRLLPISIILPFLSGYLRLEGQRIGLYDTEFGIAILVISNILIFVPIIWWYAERLDRIDTERIKTNESLQNANKENELLKTIAIEITKAKDMNSAIHVVLREVCKSTGWVYGESWIPNKDKKVLEAGISFVIDTGHYKFAEHSKRFSFKGGIGLPGRVWSSKKPEWIRDVSVNGHLFLRTEAAMESGLRAALGVPIIAENDVIAVLIFYMPEASLEDESQIKLISAISSQLGSIIQSKKAEEDKNRLESQIRHMQKIETIGQLTGGIAHDFNNLLTAIILSGNILKRKVENTPELMLFVQQILSTSERAANLTKSLLTFSRKQVIDKKAVSLNSIVQNTEKLLGRIIGEDIELRINLSERDVVLMADSGQIEQVLLNLATNARDAMPNGGALTIDINSVDIDESFTRTHAFIKTGLHAILTVSDSGTGMDNATMERIFEPFFTTKGAGKGTGLGLSIVYGIIKAHDGYINVYSEAGKGTTFKIYLPIVQSEIEVAKEQELIPPKGGTETILLVEDEVKVRNLTKNLLEGYGYKIIEAVDGEDALTIFNANKDKIQLLITDVVMPKRNGKDVYNEIRKIRPDMKALFVSGYNEEVIHKKGILEEGLNFISKPFAPTEFLRKVREVLDK
jgi:signal transduction histidine kinase